MTRKSLHIVALLAALAYLPGCFIFPLVPEDTGAATDQYRVDMEFIPTATLVSEDTSPWWDLGRHAYKVGSDRLIVIGRTTSYADKDEDHKPIPGTMRDRKMERVWVTIPSDVPLGKALKLEDLEIEFYTGYDVNNLDSKGFFKGPHLMKGYVNLVEENTDQVVAIFDIEIRPNRPFQAENWKIEGKHTIKVSNPDQPRIASLAVSRDVVVGNVPPAPNGNGNGNGNNTDPANNTSTTNPAPLVTPNTTDPRVDNANANNTAPAPGKTDEPKNTEPKSIAGKWAADNVGSFDFRFQFSPEGKFIFSHTRGDGVNDNYAPGMNYGTYQLKKTKTAEWVVLVVERCEFEGGDVMKDFYGDNKTVMLKCEWDGDNLILTGGVPILKNKTTKFVCTKGDYEDMNRVLPPRGRKKNTPGEPNAKPYW